jgi:hypothetical protein
MQWSPTYLLESRKVQPRGGGGMRMAARDSAKNLRGPKIRIFIGPTARRAHQTPTEGEISVHFGWRGLIGREPPGRLLGKMGTRKA